MTKRVNPIFSAKKELKRYKIRVKLGRNVIEDSIVIDSSQSSTFQFDENREGEVLFRPDYEMVEVEFLCSSKAELNETKKKALEKTLSVLEKREVEFLKMLKELKEKTKNEINKL